MNSGIAAYPTVQLTGEVEILTLLSNGQIGPAQYQGTTCPVCQSSLYVSKKHQQTYCLDVKCRLKFLQMVKNSAHFCSFRSFVSPSSIICSIKDFLINEALYGDGDILHRVLASEGRVLFELAGLYYQNTEELDTLLTVHQTQTRTVADVITNFQYLANVIECEPNYDEEFYRKFVHFGLVNHQHFSAL